MELDKKNGNTATYFIIGLLLIIFLIWYNQNAKKESTLKKVTDDISQGINNAKDEFKDKTPIEKVGDAVEDAGQKIKDSTE